MRLTIGLAALLALAGCTRNTVVFVMPAPAPTRLDPACAAPPAGSPPTTPAGPRVALGVFTYPPQALAAHVAFGCAGVLFRIAPDGETTDLRLVVESPAGYGFGAAMLAVVRATRFQPNPSDQNWHYDGATMRSSRAPGRPVPPPPGYSPPPNYNKAPNPSRT